VAIGSLSLPHASRIFDNAVVGVAAPTITYSIAADGDLPVTIAQLAIGGAAAADFTVSADACSGQILQPADTCSYSLAFAPSASGLRRAEVAIPSDSAAGPLVIPMYGVGLIPTTTTVSVGPDVIYNPPDLVYTVHALPLDARGFITCVVDGVPITGGSVDQNGIGRCYGPRTLGAHTVVGRLEQNTQYGGSSSAELAFDVSSTTVVSLSARPSDDTGTSVAATVSTASSLLFVGGTLTIRDETTGSTLGTLAIDPAHPSLVLTAALGVGLHRLTAMYSGVAGVLDPSDVSVDAVVLRAATGAAVHFPSGATLGSATVPISIRWTAPPSTRVARYDVSLSTDDKPYRLIGSSGSTTFMAGVAPGHRYRFRVRARDPAGDGGPWAYTADSWAISYRETSETHYSGRWHRASSTSYFGSADEYSLAAGSTAKFLFSGKGVAWIASVGPTRGSVRVYLDGRYVTTVNLHASSTKYRVVAWSTTFSRSEFHTLTLRIVGTAGHPRGDVDGFLTLE
jgi:hypothetical protein